MTDEAMRAAFEAWNSSQSQAEPEPERIYEFSEEGLNELVKETMFEAWQAATAQATAAERERCAKLCYALPWVNGGHIPSNLAFAEAIRQGTDPAEVAR